VEAISGSVPFAADTTIATLMARIDKHLDLDESFGVLGPVLERACDPDHATRPDARQLATALMAAADGQPRPQPLPLAGAVAVDLVPREPSDPTMLGGVAGAAAAVGTAAATAEDTTDEVAPTVVRPEADVPTSAQPVVDLDATLADLPV